MEAPCAYAGGGQALPGCARWLSGCREPFYCAARLHAEFQYGLKCNNLNAAAAFLRIFHPGHADYRQSSSRFICIYNQMVVIKTAHLKKPETGRAFMAYRLLFTIGTCKPAILESPAIFLILGG
jgi:hypothetical protein